MPEKDKSLDAIFEDFDISSCISRPRPAKKAITLWLPRDYAQKFADLQCQTGDEFGKKIQLLIVTSIDKFYSPAS